MPISPAKTDINCLIEHVKVLLEPQITAICRRYSTNFANHHWLSSDDLRSEMYLKIVQVCNKYSHKGEDELVKIASRSISNMTKSYLHRATRTGRKHELTSVRLDATVMGDDGGESVNHETGRGIVDDAGRSAIFSAFGSSAQLTANPSETIEYDAYVAEIFDLLDNDIIAKATLIALLGGNQRVSAYLELSRVRRAFVYRNIRRPVELTPLIIARSLCIPTHMVIKAINDIKHVITNKKNEGVV